MLKEGMQGKLKSMGLKKTYFPIWDCELGVIYLKTKRRAEIVDGYLVGSDIDLYDNQTFRVWTNRWLKCRQLSEHYKLKCNLLDGEAELYIPIELADTLLPIWARVKRIFTEGHKARLRVSLAQVGKSGLATNL